MSQLGTEINNKLRKWCSAMEVKWDRLRTDIQDASGIFWDRELRIPLRDGYTLAIGSTTMIFWPGADSKRMDLVSYATLPDADMDLLTEIPAVVVEAFEQLKVGSDIRASKIPKVLAAIEAGVAEFELIQAHRAAHNK